MNTDSENSPLVKIDLYASKKRMIGSVYLSPPTLPDCPNHYMVNYRLNGHPAGQTPVPTTCPKHLAIAYTLIQGYRFAKGKKAKYVKRDDGEFRTAPFPHTTPNLKDPVHALGSKTHRRLSKTDKMGDISISSEKVADYKNGVKKEAPRSPGQR